jgi:hypothetical protein
LTEDEYDNRERKVETDREESKAEVQESNEEAESDHKEAQQRPHDHSRTPAGSSLISTDPVQTSNDDSDLYEEIEEDRFGANRADEAKLNSFDEEMTDAPALHQANVKAHEQHDGDAQLLPSRHGEVQHDDEEQERSDREALLSEDPGEERPPNYADHIDRATSSSTGREGFLRPSIYEAEPGLLSGIQMNPFETSIFRK